MSKRITAAIAGEGAYAGKLFMFSGRHYVRFDLATGRADDAYPRRLDHWQLPSAPADRVDAALAGFGGKAGKVFFFAGGEFRSYDWAADRLDPGYPRGLDAWHLTGGFTGGIDAAVNGRGSRAGKAYFFRGAQYLRYDWATDRIDSRGIQPLARWRLPGAFATGVDAALNLPAPHGDTLCFFRDDQCLRYDAANGRVVAGYPRPIADEFPGVLELLAVGAGRDVGLDWVARARADLALAMAALPREVELAAAGLGQVVSHPPVYRAALATHFKLSTVDARARLLPTVVATVARLATALDAPEPRVRFRTAAEASAEGAAGAPGYHHDGWVAFTPHFRDFGPMCQAAMVVHESEHAVDPDSGTAAAHVYEWGSGYATQAAEDAVHNASAYAAFAQHVAYGRDERFGAGRPTE